MCRVLRTKVIRPTILTLTTTDSISQWKDSEQWVRIHILDTSTGICALHDHDDRNYRGIFHLPEQLGNNNQ
jgi:hypothetical protein